MNPDNQNQQTAAQKLRELIGDISTAMLCTVGDGNDLQSRPMINVNRTFDGDLWFFANRSDTIATDLLRDTRVNVSFACPTSKNFVSATGNGSIVNDQKRAELLWTSDCDPWFNGGVNDPNLVLIKVAVETATYWDQQQRSMLSVAGVWNNLVGSKPKIDSDHVDWTQTDKS